MSEEKKKTPKISVIIPVYNVEKYLEECLQSVVMQTMRDIEILCVEGGSKDSSMKILEQFAESDDRIHIMHQKGKGLSGARNEAIAVARGEYLFFLDSDDKLADENCFLFMAEHMDKDALDVLYFDGKSFYENERLREQFAPYYEAAYKRSKDYGCFEKGQLLFFELVMKKEYYVTVWLQCYRTSFIKKINLLFAEEMLNEDVLYTFISMLSAGRVAHYNRLTVLRRIREDSLIQSKRDFRYFYSLFYGYKEMLLFWQTHDLEEGVQPAIERELIERKNAVVRSYMALKEEQKKKVSQLSGYEKYLLNILKASLQTEKNAGFPYYLFQKPDKILLYGAGANGKKLYAQAKEDGIVKIAGILDAKADELSREELPVFPISKVKELDYDYILITVKNQQVVQEIKKNLLELEVPENIIKWDGK